MAKVQSPQLGYNTNVRHKGKLFHIQTEDSGVARPHIITHLFVDGGRILKSVKTSYADSLEEPDLVAFVRRRMQEQHKAMFVALRDGEFDALVEPSPSAVAEAPVQVAAVEAPPVDEARATAPPSALEAPALRSLAPPPRSSLSPVAGTHAVSMRPAPAPGAALRGTGAGLRNTGAGLRNTGAGLRNTGAGLPLPSEAVPVPGSMLPPRATVVEQPPSNPPVFSNSMRYTAPRTVAPPPPTVAPRAPSGPLTERFIREASLTELILAMMAEEVAS